MYVCLYVHKLLLHFLTDFLQTGKKKFQIFLASSVLFRIFYFAPAGGAPNRFCRFFSGNFAPHTFLCFRSNFFLHIKCRGVQGGQKLFSEIFTYGWGFRGKNGFLFQNFRNFLKTIYNCLKISLLKGVRYVVQCAHVLSIYLSVDHDLFSCWLYEKQLSTLPDLVPISMPEAYSSPKILRQNPPT